jgi:hypothetical protein
MAFSALSIASSRELPYPDILVPETVAAHFQWWRTMPCTTEYSIPRYSTAIAFVCHREHGPAPSRGVGVEAGPCRATCTKWPANETILWIQLFQNTGRPTTGRQMALPC